MYNVQEGECSHHTVAKISAVHQPSSFQEAYSKKDHLFGLKNILSRDIQTVVKRVTIGTLSAILSLTSMLAGP